MRMFGRRQGFLALAIGGLLVAGYGFIRARGGWSELTQMPAKRDDSTPAAQNGFELIGIARVTEAERSPRLVDGDLNLGGSQGPIGSTRLWFRLPATAEHVGAKKRRLPLRATVRFASGKAFTAGYEMADIASGIATLLIPAGHPPVEWAEVEVKARGSQARWRIKGLPQTPYALPAAGASHFEAEGAKVTARAYRQRPLPLNELPQDLASAGAVVEVRLDSPPTKGGREVQLQCERFIPEYLHPTDVRERTNPGHIVPGPHPELAIPMTFPYADEMKRIGFQGRLEVVDLIREPIAFKNVRGRWLKFDKVGVACHLMSDTTPLPDGSIAYVSGTLSKGGGNLQGYWQRQSSAGALTGPGEATIVDLVAEDKSRGWEAKVRAVEQGKGEPVDFNIGTMHGFLVRRRVVRSVPFRLLIPVEPGNPSPQPRELPRF